MDADERALMERTFNTAACERLAVAERDYLNGHAQYIVPLARLLNETRRERDQARAEVTALREALAKAERQRDGALAALDRETSALLAEVTLLREALRELWCAAADDNDGLRAEVTTLREALAWYDDHKRDDGSYDGETWGDLRALAGVPAPEEGAGRAG